MITCHFFSPPAWSADRDNLQRSPKHSFYQLLNFPTCWNKALGATDTAPRTCDCQDEQSDCSGYEESPTVVTRILVMDRQDLIEEIPRYQVVTFEEARENMGVRNVHVYRYDSHRDDNFEPVGDPTLVATLDSSRHGNNLDDVVIKLVDSLIGQGYTEYPVPSNQTRVSFVATVAAMNAAN